MDESCNSWPVNVSQCNSRSSQIVIKFFTDCVMSGASVMTQKKTPRVSATFSALLAWCLFWLFGGLRPSESPRCFVKVKAKEPEDNKGGRQWLELWCKCSRMFKQKDGLTDGWNHSPPPNSISTLCALVVVVLCIASWNWVLARLWRWILTAVRNKGVDSFRSSAENWGLVFAESRSLT